MLVGLLTLMLDAAEGATELPEATLEAFERAAASPRSSEARPSNSPAQVGAPPALRRGSCPGWFRGGVGRRVRGPDGALPRY